VSGYAPCAANGLCVRKLDDAEAELARERQCNYFEREVRQGGSLVIDVPGATADKLPEVTTGSANLEATPRAVGKTVVVDVRVKHRTSLGDVPEHSVTIKADIAGAPYTRQFQIIVTAIAASPEGLDTNPGSESEPFRTFRQAASVAETGDTIVLRNDAFGRPSEPNETNPIVLPAGVIVHGQVPRHGRPTVDEMTAGAADDTPIRTKLGMPIVLAGGATLDNLAITHRLAVTTMDSSVQLNDVDLSGGISMAASATSSSILISGGSSVYTTTEPNPILVEADDAHLEISGSSIIGHGESVTPAPVLRFTGRRQHLTLRGDVRIQNITSAVAIQLDDAQTVDIQGRERGNLRILGRLEVTGVDSMVTVANASFAQGILNGSGIHFAGRGTSSTMLIDQSQFQGEGIFLDGPDSKVIVRNTLFDEITRSGIRVVSGALDLGKMKEPGGNTFWTKADPTPDAPIPVALQIDALEGMTTVTSSASTYDGNNPGPCQIQGPTSKEMVIRGFWKIANRVAIDFY
jgi:hypothetical protein